MQGERYTVYAYLGCAELPPQRTKEPRIVSDLGGERRLTEGMRRAARREEED